MEKRNAEQIHVDIVDNMASSSNLALDTLLTKWTILNTVQ